MSLNIVPQNICWKRLLSGPSEKLEPIYLIINLTSLLEWGRYNTYLTWLKSHPALVVVSGPLSSRANVFVACNALCFVPILEDQGGCSRRSSPSSVSEGDREGENRGCDLRRQFSVVVRCICAGRGQAPWIVEHGPCSGW